MTVNVTKPAINVREKLAELDKPSGIAGEAMLRAETPQEQFNLIGAGRRNIVKNGAMQVWQRGTSFTSFSSNDGYTVDRFSYQESSSTTAVYTISQSTGPVEHGFGRSFKIEVTTADTTLDDGQYAQLNYVIEGQDIQQMAKGTSGALPVTMSFWVKSNVAGTYGLTLYDNPNTRQNSSHYTIDAVGVWEHKVVTFVGDTTGTIDNDNTEGLAIKFALSMGADYTGGTEGPSSHSGSGTTNYAPKHDVNFVSSTGNYWEITGVQLELGKVATPFEHRSYGEELALCQRYYYRHSRSGQSAYLGVAQCRSTTNAELIYFHPVPMRATPQMNSSGTIRVKTADGTSGTNQNTTAITFDDPEQFSVSLGLTVTSGLVAGNAAATYLIGSADYIEGDAEL